MTLDNNSAQLILANIADHAVIQSDLEGLITFWNSGAENLFQWKSEEVLGNSAGIIFTPEDLASGVVTQEMETAFAKGKAEDNRWHIRKDGSRFYATGIMNSYQENGIKKGFIKVLRDATALKIFSQSEKELVDILESMSDAFISVDRYWIIKRVNSQHEAVSKLKREYQIGKNFLDLFLSSEEAKNTTYWSNYHKAMNERVSVVFEDFYEPLKIWILVRVYPTPDGGLAFFFTDTTKTQELNRRIEAERQKFEAIFVDSPASMALLRGPTFIFEKVNIKYKLLMGGRDLTEKPLHEALPELIGQPFHDLMKQVFETGKPFIAHEMVAKLVREVGKEPEDTYFDFTYSRIDDGEGKPYGIYIHAIDITESVMSRRNLEENQRKLTLALRGGRMGVWNISFPGGILKGDERFNELHGTSVDEDLEEAIERKGYPEDKEIIRNAIIAAITSKQPLECEYRALDSYGNYRWIYSRGEAQYDDKGEIVLLSGVVLDITERKLAEEGLKSAIISRDEFLSIASHELKTPLTSLKLQSQLHMRLIQNQNPKAYEPGRIDELVKQTDKQIIRLTRLVDDMLDVSRISSGNLIIQREEFDICSLIEDVLERLKDQFQSSSYELPTFAPCTDGIGFWDRMRIEQVVINLLTNAIRYGNKKPITVRVKSAVSNIRIIVRDNGIGVSDSAKTKIFDRFERDVNANEVSGLGLGLFITKKIVNAHGGKIWVESKLGEGSTFIVELPKNLNNDTSSEV